MFNMNVSSETCRNNVMVSGCALAHVLFWFSSNDMILGLYVTGIAVSESTSISFSYADTDRGPVILLLRTWALWNCRKLIGAILVLVFLGACACAVAIETRLGSSLNGLSHTRFIF